VSEPFEYDDLLAVYTAARGFIATTSIFRQNKVSRDSFEALALAVLKLRMIEAGRAMGEIDVA
jgi:hypothetical protein